MKIYKGLFYFLLLASIFSSCNIFKKNEAQDNINHLGVINYMLNEVQDNVNENLENLETISRRLKRKDFMNLWANKLEAPEFNALLFDEAIAANEDLPEEINKQLEHLLVDIKKAALQAPEKVKEINNSIDAEEFKDDIDGTLALCMEIQSIYEYLFEMTNTIGAITDKYYDQFELDALPSGIDGDAQRNMIVDRRIAEEILDNLGYFWEDGALKKADSLIHELEQAHDEHIKLETDLGTIGPMYKVYYEVGVTTFINRSKKFLREAKSNEIKEKDFASKYDNVLSGYNIIISNYNDYMETKAALPH